MVEKIFRYTATVGDAVIPTTFTYERTSTNVKNVCSLILAADASRDMVIRIAPGAHNLLNTPDYTTPVALLYLHGHIASYALPSAPWVLTEALPDVVNMLTAGDADATAQANVFNDAILRNHLLIPCNALTPDMYNAAVVLHRGIAAWNANADTVFNIATTFEIPPIRVTFFHPGNFNRPGQARPTEDGF